jgi:hypothetical protein
VANATPFAAEREPMSASALTQVAKTTLFATGNKAVICKKRRQATFCQ